MASATRTPGSTLGLVVLLMITCVCGCPQPLDPGGSSLAPSLGSNEGQRPNPSSTDDTTTPAGQSGTGTSGTGGSGQQSGDYGDTVLSPQTIIVGSESGLTATSVEPSRIILSAASGAPSIQGGSILAGWGPDGVPFLRRVVAVSPAGDSIAVTTEQATLVEAIERGTFEFIDGPPDPKGSGRSKRISLFSFNEDLDGTSLHQHGGLSVTLPSANFTFDLALDLEISIEGHEITYFLSAVEGSAHVRLESELAAQIGDDLEEEFSLLAAPKHHYFYGMIGPVPVMLEVTGDLLAGIEGNALAGASFDVGFDAQSFVRLGAEYSGYAWHQIKEQGFTPTMIGPEWCLSGELSAEVYLKPVVSAKFYGIAGPQFTLQPSLTFDADGHTCNTERAGMYAWSLDSHLKGIVEVRAEVLDLELAKFGPLDLFELTWPLASERCETVAPLIQPIADDTIIVSQPYTGPTPQLSQGTPPITWSLVHGPSGMTINSSTGVVSWSNPSVYGSPHPIRIRAENSLSYATEDWLLTVVKAPPVIDSIPDGQAVAGQAYTGPTPQLLQGTPPVYWSLTSGPAGVTIGWQTGVVSWPNPTVDGSPHTITIRAANDVGSDEESWLLTVTPTAVPPIIAEIADQQITEGSPYSYVPQLEQGTPPVSWSLVQGPNGMTINSATGEVSWPSATAAGSPHPITIRATNSAGSDDESWLLTVTGGGGEPVVEVTLYRISDTSGTMHTADPGVEKISFEPGETARVTMRAANTGAAVPAMCVLNVAKDQGQGEWIYDSHDPNQTPSGQIEDVVGGLAQGETRYYSFDVLVPQEATGQYELLAAIRDVAWEPVYDDTEPGSNTTELGPEAWIGGFSAGPIYEWQPLGSGMGGDYPASVATLTVYSEDLIAGGYFTTAGGVTCNRVARWDGSTWYPLGSGMNDRVRSLTVYDGELIAGGGFTAAGGVTCKRIAGWDGSTWHTLGSGIAGTEYPNVDALTVYNGDLIVGGCFWNAGGVACNHIARWDGSTWQPLGSGMNRMVQALTVHNNDLIAGGCFWNAGGVACNHIARWDGSTWQPLGAGMNDFVCSLTVYNGDLIAAGPFTSAGSTASNRIARWDGSTWQPLGAGMNDIVYSLTVYNGELIAGGYFTTADGVMCNGIASWNGTTWHALGEGMGGYSRSVMGMTVFDQELIAGGAFTTAGGVPCTFIAKWAPGE